MNLVISLFLISSYRLAVKFYHQKMFVSHENISKVLIFGCGNSGILTKELCIIIMNIKLLVLLMMIN